MRTTAAVLALLGTLALGAAASRALAQPPAANAVRTDPETGAQFREVRPPPGLARGAWPVPKWAVAMGGAGIALASASLLAWRLGRRRS